MEDDDIVHEFLVESHENLDQLDRDLVDLEQSPTSRELLSAIFRSIHTIKGTSGFLAYGRLERLTHVGENVLSSLRDGDLTLTEPIAGTLLHMVDAVRGLLAAIERTGSDDDASIQIDGVVERLRRIADGEELDASPAVATPAAATPTATAEYAEVGALAAIESSAAVSEATATSPAAPPAVDAIPESTQEPNLSSISEAVAQPVVELAAVDVPRSTVGDSTVRVDVELLDTLVRLVGELVLTRNQILQQAGLDADAELVRASQRLNIVASELQESVMRTRMQPIGQVWSKFPRIVRDLGAQLGRDVRLVMDGQETELDRSLLEAVRDPLTHLVRNAIDHGIEPPDHRVAAGKAPHGMLLLRAKHESGQVIVEITDDGKGLDPRRIGEVAIQRGVVTSDQLARMSERELTDLIFRPGFSTAAAVTNVSGRGVGMDVVRTNIEAIGGTVDLTSEPGRGTTVRVRIPLTLAIIPALIVGEGGERFAIPQANLVELVRLDAQEQADQVEVLAGAPILRLRGQLLPLVSLGEALGTSLAESANAGDGVTVVVVQADDIRFGLALTDVHDTQEIVVKPLGRQMKGIAMYAGATIMGDGRVALILDVAGLAHSAGVTSSNVHVDTASYGENANTSTLLVLDVGQGRRAALPLAKVSRLEELPVERIERSGHSEVVQYRGGILPLIRLADAIGLPRDLEQPETVSVVVHETPSGSVGIVARGVVDVVEASVAVNRVGVRHGVSGTLVVGDRVTDLVDLLAIVTEGGQAA